MPSPKTIAAAARELRAYLATFPETVETHPWGHSAFKVNGKAFAYITDDLPGEMTVSMKLTDSHEAALLFPFTEPTHYGAGKWGWVTSSFDKASGEIPVGILKKWIDESYRAIAPKRLTKAGTPKKAVRSGTPRKKTVKRSR